MMSTQSTARRRATQAAQRALLLAYTADGAQEAADVARERAREARQEALRLDGEATVALAEVRQERREEAWTRKHAEAMQKSSIMNKLNELTIEELAQLI